MGCWSVVRLAHAISESVFFSFQSRPEDGWVMILGSYP